MLALPFCFPRALTLGVVVLVMLVVRVVWAPEWMIVSVAAVGEGGMGVRVDEAGAGLWLMVVSWWVSCCRCRRRRWCWCL